VREKSRRRGENHRATARVFRHSRVCVRARRCACECVREKESSSEMTERGIALVSPPRAEGLDTLMRARALECLVCAPVRNM